MAITEAPVQYNASLRNIEADAVRLGSLVLEMVSLATAVALDGNDALVDKVLAWEKEVDVVERGIVERAIVAMGTENPGPGDLMFLSATLFLVNELEKIGDEATKLASRVQKLHGEFPYELGELLREMSIMARSNLGESLRLYSQYSPEAAEALIQMDDRVDRIYKTSRKLLLGMIQSEPDKSRQFLRCLEIFHALEHVSDRASDIAKRLQACYEPYIKSS
jgi:phosphate transport system protein